MISHLRGTIHRLDPGEVAVDTAGVGYLVMTPMDVWDKLEEGQQHMVWISTYVREDRFDLYGFLDHAGRTLFEEFIKIAGIGPRLALELCGVPRSMLLQAITTNDVSLLTSVKGVGKKTAEKLLLELRSLQERKAAILGSVDGEVLRHEYDRDAIAALTQLGYDTSTVLKVLKDLPPELTSTEERVATALRSL